MKKESVICSAENQEDILRSATTKALAAEKTARQMSEAARSAKRRFKEARKAFKEAKKAAKKAEKRARRAQEELDVWVESMAKARDQSPVPAERTVAAKPARDNESATRNSGQRKQARLKRRVVLPPAMPADGGQTAASIGSSPTGLAAAAGVCDPLKATAVTMSGNQK